MPSSWHNTVNVHYCAQSYISLNITKLNLFHVCWQQTMFIGIYDYDKHCINMVQLEMEVVEVIINCVCVCVSVPY